VAGPSNITIASTSSGSPGKSPGISGNGNSGGQPRRKRLKTDRSLLKDREYDPDRHCGVWNEETGKPCTRSLTCKAHTVSLRRTVVGRSKTFDKLLAEHRAAKEQPNSGNSRQTKMTVTGAVTVSSSVASSLNNPHAPNTPVSIIEPEAPSSPPVLSLPDTYPLPKVSKRLFFFSFSRYCILNLFTYIPLLIYPLCSDFASVIPPFAMLMLQLVSTAQAIIAKRTRLLAQRRNESFGLILCRGGEISFEFI